MEEILQDENMVRDFVFKEPVNSCILINGNAVSHYEYIKSMENKDLIEAIKRIVPRIDVEKISAVINSVSSYYPVHSKFLYKIVRGKYENILLPAYKEISRNCNANAEL